MRRLAVTLVLLVLSTPAAAVEGEPPPEDTRALIAAVIEAYGGRAALDTVTSYRMEGSIVAIRQGKSGAAVRLFRRPDRLRVELRYPEAPEIRTLDRSRGWRSIGGERTVARGPMLDAMLLQAARANVPWILIERGDSARAIEPRDLRGRVLFGLEIPLENHLIVRFYVDPETHRVEISSGLLTHGGMETRFETVYGDFRMVDGVLFAFREENHASGVHTGDTAFEHVTLNPRTRPADFTPPPTPPVTD